MSASPFAAPLDTLQQAQAFLAATAAYDAQDVPTTAVLAKLRQLVAEVGNALQLAQANQTKLDLAGTAVTQLLLRIASNPRLAYYFDPLTNSYERLTEAHAAIHGLDLAEFRALFETRLRFEAPSCSECGEAAAAAEALPLAPVEAPGIDVPGIAECTTPYTLRFTEWRCGHHGQRPEDIPVSSPEQASLILQAISHAITQSGHFRALLMNSERAIPAYITDDYVSAGNGNTSVFPLDPHKWTRRPEVILCTPEEEEAIHSPAMVDAVESTHVQIDRWDGCTRVDDVYATVTTTLSREAVDAIATPIEWYEENARQQLFDSPPVYLIGSEILAALQEEAASLAVTSVMADEEGGAA